MKLKVIRAVRDGLGSGNYVENSRTRVDDRRAGNANFRIQIKVWAVAGISVASDDANILARNWRPKVNVPKGGFSIRIIRIECVHTAVLGGSVYDVVIRALHVHTGNVQGLRINVSVNCAPEKLAEITLVDIRRV